ncbi:Asp-tRNA(Asn)/Glu-tRNA(Gln) amidotransferase subunit GatB [Ferrovibrio terrae]|uniref:Asp-tRNA(Asn)/Glu-tRNA(Gln) amidotransferase subunit GatB n=1 Tax=Ferrovibrio terrae TaxID=2594003 RepID=UPI00313791A1
MAEKDYIQGATGPWEIVIGMEVHAQVSSKSKLFSGADATFGAEPNHQVSLVDAAMPGMLPVINGYCVEQAVRTGLGLKAQINLHSVFDRKNYFYADLPQGYQISQYLQPIVGKGVLLLDMPDGSTREIGITRLHLEQDAGKSLHDQSPRESFIDLNRSGVALMEIVSEPDMRNSEEAGLYLKKLRTIVRYLGTCDGNMDEGSMRADVNVSVRKPGGPLGTRCEIKNVNSVRFVQQAIEYEARRQIEILEEGGKIDQETRLFDTGKGVTRSMRSKEEAHDYRYFPDPDLLPLEFEQAWVDGIKATLPELPDEKKARFIEKLGLSPYDASVLVAEKESADFYEKVAKGRDGKLAANWVITEYFGLLNKSGQSMEDFVITAEKLGGLIDLISDNTISNRLAKDVFALMVETGKDAATIVEEKGMRQVTDTGAIEKVIDEVMAANPDKVAEYRSGKDKLFGFFVGQTMKASGGKANPNAVNELLKKKLAG